MAKKRPDLAGAVKKKRGNSASRASAQGRGPSPPIGSAIPVTGSPSQFAPRRPPPMARDSLRQTWPFSNTTTLSKKAMEKVSRVKASG